MDAVSDLLLLGLLLLLVTVPVATRAYQAGQEAGYTTGLEEGLAHKDAPGLEILDTFTSGRVYWRYGAGRTELSGYCDKTSYPAGYTARELAQHFQVNRRTIYRDLALLEELGIPLIKGDERRDPFRILGTYTRPAYRASLIPA